MALGQARAVGAEHERDVRVGRGGQAEPRRDVQLARRRLDEVGAAHHFAHALRCVVDDHGEIVCGRAVVAAHDQVVDDAVVRSEQPIGERRRSPRGAQAQRRRAPGALALGALRPRVSSRQVPG